jgi:ABC-2 type transport system ATP-binding protein
VAESSREPDPQRVTTPAMLEVCGVRKAYGETIALDGVDLTVDSGSILGLLGPNGAGKTSLVSIIAGLRRPDAGSVSVAGIDVGRDAHRARQLIGFAPQETGVYPTLTVRDNLRFFAGLAGLRRAELTERVDAVGNALGLTVHRPRLVLLDEPTTGADVRTRNEILTLVRGLADEGSAVVYSTHYLHEIEMLSADIAFIDHGRIVARGALDDLVREHGSSALVLKFSGRVPDAAARAEGAIVDGTSVRIPTPEPAAFAAHLLVELGGDSAGLLALEVVRPSLESVFLAVTGRRYEPVA